MESKNIISSFVYEDDKEYILTYPTVNIIRESNYKHRKAFTEAIKNGFYTKKKLELILQEGEINVISDHISRRSEILSEYSKATDLIANIEDPDQLEGIASLLQNYRESFIQEDISMNSLFSNTAEQVAEDERINFLTFSLIKYKDGNTVWKSYDDYSSDLNYLFIERCKYEVLKWEYKIDAINNSNTPESRALNKAKELRKQKENNITNVSNMDTLPVKEKTKNSNKTKQNKTSKKQVTTDGDTNPI